MQMNPLLVMALGIQVWVIVVIIVAVIVLGLLIGLGIYSKKMQDKQNDAMKEMQAVSQNVSLLVIDKKRMKLKDAGLPPIVLEETPKYLRGSKLPIVKAKIGPKIMSLMCDEKIFDLIPVKKEVRAVISGIYIMEVKGLRTNLDTAPKKRTFMDKIRAKAGRK